MLLTQKNKERVGKAEYREAAWDIHSSQSIILDLRVAIFDSQNREIFHFVHTPWLESGTPGFNWFCVSLNPIYDQQATNSISIMELLIN